MIEDTLTVLSDSFGKVEDTKTVDSRGRCGPKEEKIQRGDNNELMCCDPCFFDGCLGDAQ